MFLNTHLTIYVYLFVCRELLDRGKDLYWIIAHIWKIFTEHIKNQVRIEMPFLGIKDLYILVLSFQKYQISCTFYKYIGISLTPYTITSPTLEYTHKTNNLNVTS